MNTSLSSAVAGCALDAVADMTRRIARLLVASCTMVLVSNTSVFAQQPEYEIISLGLAGESVSGGQAVSEDGQFAGGFTDNDPFLWQTGVGSVGLPSEATRPFSEPWGVSNAGTIAGIGATTFFGSGALPIIWQNGIAIPLQLPAGQTLGRAYAISNNELIVGSVDGGSLERAASFSPDGPGTILTQTLAGGVLTTAYGVNDAGRIVGQALDPNNAAVIKGFYLDPGDTEASDVGALVSLGHNSAIAFDVSSNGLITGSSSINGGADGRPFLWREADGMTEIALPTATSTASGRGVNADGWVVGTAGGVFAIPFLYDGTATYRLHDLMALGADGWDLETGTSNGAFSIADNGTIVGRGLLNGQLTAFAMVLIEEGKDSDSDGVPDASDNCTLVENADQRDTNADGIGNICDPDITGAAGDPANNCLVDFFDLGDLKAAFLTTPASGNWNPDADFDGDDLVGFLDVAVTKEFFLAAPGPAANPNAASGCLP